MTVLCNTKYALNKLWQLAIISELDNNKHYKDKPVANIIDQLAGGVNTDQKVHRIVDQHDKGKDQWRVTIVEGYATVT